MESLRPDREEVDNFQRSRKTGKGSGKSKGKPEINSGTKSSALTKIPASRSNSVLWFVMALFIAGASAAGWMFYKQQQKLGVMTEELNDALVFIRQSKLLMARFEGQLSETGAELVEGDTDAQKKLKFLESEVRKLWGVAYDRNKKAIAANDGALKQHASELKSLETSLIKQTKSVEALTEKVNKSAVSVSALQSAIAVLQSERSELNELNSQMQVRLKQIEDASGSAVAEIRQSIEELKGSNEVEGRVRQNEVAIEAIDASRLQLNERIVAVDRRLNDLQLLIKTLQPSDSQNAP